MCQATFQALLEQEFFLFETQLLKYRDLRFGALPVSGVPQEIKGFGIASSFPNRKQQEMLFDVMEEF